MTERLTNIDKEIDHQAIQVARNESFKAQVIHNYKASPSPAGPAIASQKQDLNHNSILTLIIKLKEQEMMERENLLKVS
jgi:hypothetical protein